jgi:hypothetical protein
MNDCQLSAQHRLTEMKMGICPIMAQNYVFLTTERRNSLELTLVRGPSQVGMDPGLLMVVLTTHRRSMMQLQVTDVTKIWG